MGRLPRLILTGLICSTSLTAVEQTSSCVSKISSLAYVRDQSLQTESVDSLRLQGPGGLPDGKVLVSAMSESEGLHQVLAQIDTLSEEHEWFFVREHNLWVDVTMYVEGSTVTSDHDLVLALAKAFPGSIIYHTHPTKLAEIYLETWIKQLPAGVDPAVLASAPSSLDLVASISRNHQAGRSARLESGIVHKFGTTSLMPTELVWRKEVGAVYPYQFENFSLRDLEGLRPDEAINALLDFVIKQSYSPTLGPDFPAYEVRFQRR